MLRPPTIRPLARARSPFAAIAGAIALWCAGCAVGPVAWHDDVGAARRRALASDRLVLVHFEATDRPLGAEMAEHGFDDARVRAAIAGDFVAVRCRASDEPELFLRAVGQRGGLATCVVDADGRLVAAWPGHATAAELVGFLATARAVALELGACRAALARGDEPGPLELRIGTLLAQHGCALPAREALERARCAGGGVAARAALELARIDIAAGDVLAARTSLDEARRLDPDSAHGTHRDAAILRARLLVVERRGSDAVRELDALAREAGAGGVDSTLELARACRAAGDDGRAHALLDRVLRDHAGTAWAELARRELDEMHSGSAGHVHGPGESHDHDVRHDHDDPARSPDPRTPRGMR